MGIYERLADHASAPSRTAFESAYQGDGPSQALDFFFFLVALGELHGPPVAAFCREPELIESARAAGRLTDLQAVARTAARSA